MSSRCVTLALYGVALASSVGGCGELKSAPSPPLQEQATGERPRDADVPEPIELTQGVARLQPVDGEQARGTVELTQTSDGVVVDAEIRDLAPARHAVHVHAASDCSARTLSRSGACLDRPAPLPDRSEREDQTPDDEPRAHCLGDLGTVQPDADGVAHLEGMVPALTLERGAANSLPGRVIIVHEWVDDWARDPEAEPGRAVACGTIRLVRPMS